MKDWGITIPKTGIGSTYFHEGFSIKPSCMDNDVHKGLQWAILKRTLVYAYIELVQESLQRRFWTDRRNTSSYDSACPSSVKFSRTLFRPAFAFFKR